MVPGAHPHPEIPKVPPPPPPGVHPVFTSRKIKDELKAKEPKPPIVNQQNVVYSFQCVFRWTRDQTRQYGERTVFNLTRQFDLKYKEIALALGLTNVQKKQKINLETNWKLTSWLSP